MNKEYVCDIFRITKIDDDLLKYLSTHDIIDSDYLVACNYELVKSSANVINLGDYYVDIDNINNESIDTICDLINSGESSEILLKSYVVNPHIGMLFISNIRAKNYNYKRLRYI